MANEMKCQCKHCGTELELDHTGVCPSCGKTGKAYELSISDTVGIVDTIEVKNVSHKLPEEERKLWEKIVAFLKDTIIMDGFEIGFPSGIKIIFRIKNKT